MLELTWEQEQDIRDYNIWLAETQAAKHYRTEWEECMSREAEEFAQVEAEDEAYLATLVLPALAEEETTPAWFEEVDFDGEPWPGGNDDVDYMGGR